MSPSVATKPESAPPAEPDAPALRPSALDQLAAREDQRRRDTVARFWLFVVRVAGGDELSPAELDQFEADVRFFGFEQHQLSMFVHEAESAIELEREAAVARRAAGADRIGALQDDLGSAQAALKKAIEGPRKKVLAAVAALRAAEERAETAADADRVVAEFWSASRPEAPRPHELRMALRSWMSNGSGTDG